MDLGIGIKNSVYKLIDDFSNLSKRNFTFVFITLLVNEVFVVMFRLPGCDKLFTCTPSRDTQSLRRHSYKLPYLAYVLL